MGAGIGIGMGYTDCKHEFDQMAKEQAGRDKEVTVLRKQKATMMRQLHEKDELLKHCAAQEALLKDEVEKAAASRVRSTVNVEYLHNIMVKFLELEAEDEHESLVPVITTILAFSPEEIARVAAARQSGNRFVSRFTSMIGDGT